MTPESVAAKIHPACQLAAGHPIPRSLSSELALTSVPPEGWLAQFIEESACDLSWPLEEKEQVIKALKKHLEGTYTHTAKLDKGLQIIFQKLRLKDESGRFVISKEKRVLILTRLFEDVGECTPGFHCRVNEALQSLKPINTIEEHLYHYRYQLVDKVARPISERVKWGFRVHQYNAVFVLASHLQLGVIPPSLDDVHSQPLADRDQIDLLDSFQKYYRPIHLVEAIKKQLRQQLGLLGYAGYNKDGYTLGVFAPIKRYFATFLEITLSERDIFLFNEDSAIVDIQWKKVEESIVPLLREKELLNMSDSAYRALEVWHNHYAPFVIRLALQDELLLSEEDCQRAAITGEQFSLVRFETALARLCALDDFKDEDIAKVISLLAQSFRAFPDDIDKQCNLIKSKISTENYQNLIKEMVRTPSIWASLKAGSQRASKNLLKQILEDEESTDEFKRTILFEKIDDQLLLQFVLKHGGADGFVYLFNQHLIHGADLAYFKELKSEQVPFFLITFSILGNANNTVMNYLLTKPFKDWLGLNFRGQYLLDRIFHYAPKLAIKFLDKVDIKDDELMRNIEWQLFSIRKDKGSHPLSTVFYYPSENLFNRLYLFVKENGYEYRFKATVEHHVSDWLSQLVEEAPESVAPFFMKLKKIGLSEVKFDFTDSEIRNILTKLKGRSLNLFLDNLFYQNNFYQLKKSLAYCLDIPAVDSELKLQIMKLLLDKFIEEHDEQYSYDGSLCCGCFKFWHSEQEQVEAAKRLNEEIAHCSSTNLSFFKRSYEGNSALREGPLGQLCQIAARYIPEEVVEPAAAARAPVL